MLCHYPDPFNILAIKAGFSVERDEKETTITTTATKTTSVTIIAVD